MDGQQYNTQQATQPNVQSSSYYQQQAPAPHQQDYQQPRYIPENSYAFKGSQSGSIWVAILRVFGWILFGSIILTGFIISARFFRMLQYGITGFRLLAGLGSIFASVVVAFLTVGMLMTFLDIAGDIRIMRLLAQEQSKTKKKD